MSDKVAQIHINGINVGSIPEPVYRALVSQPLKDPSFYYGYLITLISIVVRVSAALTIGMPCFFILMLMGMAIFDTASFASMVQMLRVSEPEAIAGGVRRMLELCGLASLVVIFIGSMINPKYFGFISPFQAAIHHKMRIYLREPAPGDVSVSIEHPQVAGDAGSNTRLVSRSLQPGA